MGIGENQVYTKIDFCGYGNNVDITNTMPLGNFGMLPLGNSQMSLCSSSGTSLFGNCGMPLFGNSEILPFGNFGTLSCGSSRITPYNIYNVTPPFYSINNNFQLPSLSMPSEFNIFGYFNKPLFLNNMSSIFSASSNPTLSVNSDRQTVAEGEHTKFSKPPKYVLKKGLLKGTLKGKEQMVEDICYKYSVDPKIVTSIIALECGWGKSDLAKHNNFGGYRAPGDAGVDEKGFGYFSSVEKGLEATISNLANYPKKYPEITGINYENLDKIGNRYCPGGKWAGKVRDIYNSNVA